MMLCIDLFWRFIVIYLENDMNWVHKKYKIKFLWTKFLKGVSCPIYSNMNLGAT